MKRTWAVLCLVAFLLAGCGKAPYVNTQQSSEEYVFGEDHGQFYNTLGASDAAFITKAEQGYYYFDWFRRMLFYWDAENTVTLPLCARPECEHDDETCDAFAGYEYQFIRLQYYGGWLYLIGVDASGNVCVLRISCDGNTWKKVGVIANIQGKGAYDSLIHRGYAYYILTSGTSAEDGTKLYRLCLNGREDSELVYTGKSYAGGELKLGAYANALYIRDNHLTADGYSGNLLRYQIHDNTVEPVAEQIWRSWTVFGNTLYYDNGSQVLAQDLTTGEEMVLAEPGMPVYLSCWGDYLVCDDSCGLWLSGSGYDQRKLTLCDRITGEQLAIIPLTQEHSELIGVDGENLITMIPAQKENSDAYDGVFCVCSIQDAVKGSVAWISLA